MKISLIALGSKMPDWVNQGYQDYAKRIASPWQIALHELPIPKRGKNAPIDPLKNQEGQALIHASQHATCRIALDEHGKNMDTKMLAQMLGELRQQHSHIAFLMGGPDGHSRDCLAQCQITWSLSPLTFPHGLVRIVVTEQLYRAISIINGHPYHRE